MKWLRGWPGRLLSGAVGVGLVVALVRGAGASRVAAVLVGTGPWLPAILLLELAQLLSDVVALRALLADERASVPLATWVRSSAVAYAMMILIPAGRAAGEVTRATLLAAHVGAPRAAAASTQLQAAYLLANAFASVLACLGVLAHAGGNTLGALLVANAVLMAAAAGTLIAILRHGRFGLWLEHLRARWMPRAAPVAAMDERARFHALGGAIAVCCTGRLAQLAQYAVILGAIGGAVSVPGALAAHGIHVVGATVGDVLPNQLGVVDAAYRAFAPVLGLARAPERALSIAVVAHAEQLALALACVIVALLVRHGPATARAAPASTRADAHS